MGSGDSLWMKIEVRTDIYNDGAIRVLDKKFSKKIFLEKM